MSEVKRYEVDYDHSLCESNDGPVVYYEDYAALQQKLDAVLAENVVLKEGNQLALDIICDDNTYVALPWQSSIGKVGVETPATDAFLNEVRAEGVDLFISELSDLFKTLKTGGKPWQAIKGVAMRGAAFAAQLRTGSNEGGV